MSRQFRICMAKGGSESARPSYSRPKLTLNSRRKKITLGSVGKILEATILTLEQNPPKRNFFNIYNNFLSRGFCSNMKIAADQVFQTPRYFCWQLAFYWHLPTSGRLNKVKRPCSHCLSTWHLLPYI